MKVLNNRSRLRGRIGETSAITEDESHSMIIAVRKGKEGRRTAYASELCCCVGEDETRLNDPLRNRAGRYVVS